MGHTVRHLHSLWEGRALLHSSVLGYQAYVLTSYLVGGSLDISLCPSNRPSKSRYPHVIPASAPQQECPHRSLHCLCHHHCLRDRLLLGSLIPVSSHCQTLGYEYAGSLCPDTSVAGQWYLQRCYRHHGPSRASTRLDEVGSQYADEGFSGWCVRCRFIVRS